jgi:hypothetical protein
MKTLSSKLLATLGALSVGMSMAVNVQAIDKPSAYPSIAQVAPGPNAAPKINSRSNMVALKAWTYPVRPFCLRCETHLFWIRFKLEIK